MENMLASFVQSFETREASCKGSFLSQAATQGLHWHCRINFRTCESVPEDSEELGRRPNLKCADLAVRLSRITPYRAEIEWCKGSCDKSDEKLGYYDAFKQRGSSKRGHKVNMNRHKLSAF
ncbi:hypothetical protein GBA52_014688 [Prunus armeniaca]|nr:hypothetical protein GBA52_014688 [Prunus armeniaca]